MKRLKRIWDDIRSGENIDLYATILVAFTMAVLTVLNVNTGPFIGPVSLAVLGVLAASALTNRHKLNELYEKSVTSNQLRFMDSLPSTFASELESAQDVWIMGSALRRTIDKHYSLFERMVTRGVSLKFILINPASQACMIAALKRMPRVDVSSYRSQIESTLEQICSLRTISDKCVEIRLTDIPPGFTMYAINPKSNFGKLYLSYLPYESYSEYRLKMLLLPSDGYAYEAFLQDLFSHWENAAPWECETKKQASRKHLPKPISGAQRLRR